MTRPAFLFLLAFVAATRAVAADAVVELRASAALDGAVFRLADIARVREAGEPARQGLEAMEIGVVPRPGHTYRLSQPQVERLIEAHAPAWRGRFRMAGSPAVSVRGVGTALDRAQAVRLAAAALHAALDTRHARVAITPVGQLRELTLPSAARLRARPVEAPLARRMAVWIDIDVDGRAAGALPVWFAVSAWDRVPVAKSDLPQGSTLRAADLAMEMREVAAGAPVVDQLPPDGAVRLRHPLARGMPLTAAALETPGAVSRDQPVSVRVAAGSIEIETAAVALDDGRVGDAVRVRNPGSKEPFVATVVAPGVVSVNSR